MRHTATRLFAAMMTQFASASRTIVAHSSASSSRRSSEHGDDDSRESGER